MTPTLFDTPAEGLTAELALLDRVAKGGGERLAMVWQAAHAGLVAPLPFERADPARFTAAAGQSAARGWPATTRRTGGGITPQGPGVLNLAMALPAGADGSSSIAECYNLICAPLVAAFAAFGVPAATGAVQGSFCDGDYNLEVGGRKIVGTAQRWRGGSVLSQSGSVLLHALILTDVDLAGAVTAVQAFSDDLGRPERFEVGVHTRLADLGQGIDASALLTALAGELGRRGYDLTSD